MKTKAVFLWALTLAACDPLTDSHFDGSQPNRSNAPTTNGPSASPTPRTTQPLNDPSHCDNTTWSNSLSYSARYSAGVPGVQAMFGRDGDGTKLTVYNFATFSLGAGGSGTTTATVTLVPLAADLNSCVSLGGCILLSFGGKTYTPASGDMSILVEVGLPSQITVTLTKAVFTPLDGVGPTLCLDGPSKQIKSPFAGWACSDFGLSPTDAQQCLTLPGTGAQMRASCSSDALTIAQACSTGTTCHTSPWTCQ